MPPSSIREAATAAARQARRRVRRHIRPAIACPAGGGVGTVRCLMVWDPRCRRPIAMRRHRTQQVTALSRRGRLTSEAGAAAATPYGAGGTTGYLRLPVRRRRRLPRPPGLQRGTAEVAPPNGDTPAGDTATGAPRAEGEFPPRRRRRRPPPRVGEAVPAGQDQSADGARRDTPRPPYGREPHRRPGEEGSRDGQPQRFGETPIASAAVDRVMGTAAAHAAANAATATTAAGARAAREMGSAGGDATRRQGASSRSSIR